MEISEEVMSRVREWLSYEYDSDTRERVQYLLENDPAGLQEAFGSDLEFGTGGMRGLMGVGPNRLNIYTVARATQGLANYLHNYYTQATELRVAIAYDCRNNSSRFAEIAADTLAANGIRVFLYESLRPTPQLSFTVRTLACQAGIVITASHNPKEYNGYKVYWCDGAQVVAPHDKGIIEQVHLLTKPEEIKHKGDPNNIVRIGNEIDEVYLSSLLSSPYCQQKLPTKANDLVIVYTPIHGTGGNLIPQLLKRRGYKNIHVVNKQKEADGNFSTVNSPNPEDPEAMSMAVLLAQETNANIVLGTDPDADRIGLYARNTQGDLIRFDGNQIATLLTYYILEKEKELGRNKGKRFMVRTIVTSPLLDTIAAAYKVEMRQVLTGFKYIAQEIALAEAKYRFVMGAEESHGYLVGSSVRDKDAVQAALLLADFATWALVHKTDLHEILLHIYAKFGYWKHTQHSLVRKGSKGLEEIAERMRKLRTTPPHEIAGEKVVRFTDYTTGESLNLQNNQELTPVTLRADVLEFVTNKGSQILIRPSGTEPKIKYYIGVCNNEYSPSIDSLLKEKIDHMLTSIID